MITFCRKRGKNPTTSDGMPHFNPIENYFSVVNKLPVETVADWINFQNKLRSTFSTHKMNSEKKIQSEIINFDPKTSKMKS